MFSRRASLVVGFIGVIAPGSDISAQDSDGDIPSAVIAVLDQSAESYSSAARGSFESLVADSEAEVTRVGSESGRRIDDRVRSARELYRELVTYQESGTRPASQRLAAAVIRHEKRLEVARAECGRSFDRVAEPYLVGDRKLARAIVAEKQRVIDAPIEFSGGWRERIGREAVRCAIAALSAGEVSETDAVRYGLSKEHVHHIAIALRGARAEREKSLDVSRGVVLDAFDTAMKRLAGMGTLSVGQRIERCDELQKRKDEFARFASLTDPSLLTPTVVREYRKHVAAANHRFRKAYDDAANECLPVSIALAEAVLSLRDEVLEVVELPISNAANVLSGSWRVEATEIVQSGRGPSTKKLTVGDASWSEYDVTVEGIVVDGNPCGLTVLFHLKDESNYRAFSIGAYQDQEWSEVTKMVDGKWNRLPGDLQKDPIERGKWYNLCIEVRGARVKCFRDGVELFDSTDQDATSGYVGLGCWDGEVRFRNLVVRDPEGALLWRGPPDLGN